jgi:hypothetical protein
MNISGVILVIIVALWGSLLVPALVRKHDNVTEVRSVDRFSYALRILSRRTPYVPGRRDVLVARRSAAERRPVVSPAPEFVAAVAPPMTPAARVAARRAALARKRRRALLGLTLALILTVTLAVRDGGRWWLTVAISVVLIVMYVTNLRTEAKQLATVERRRAHARRMAGRRQAAEVSPRSRRVAEPAAAYAASAEYVVPVTSMPDGSWAPVPVTLPTYVSKPVVNRPPMAPPAGGWFDGVLAEQQAARFASGGDLYDQMQDDSAAGLGGGLGLGRDDDAHYGLYGPDGLDEIIERRRAVND